MVIMFLFLVFNLRDLYCQGYKKNKEKNKKLGAKPNVRPPRAVRPIGGQFRRLAYWPRAVWVNISRVYFLLVYTSFPSLNMRGIVVDNAVFPIVDMLLRSGDISDRSLK